MKKKIFIALAIMTLTVSAFAQEKLKADGEIPIIGHGGVPADLMSLERLKEFKECGFNISMTGARSVEEMEKFLDMAQKVGVKLGAGCPELYKEPEKTARRLMKHPALVFYTITDEPDVSVFARLGELVKKIQSVDKENICYINMLPKCDGSLINGSWIAFVDSLLRVAPVQVISYDRYSIHENDGKHFMERDFYENLEDAAVLSAKHGLPLWTFALAMPHTMPYAVYPTPTVADLRFMHYSSLAYGSQGLQYFSYAPWRSIDNFKDAIIGHNGKRTVIYDRVKLVNNEIQTLAGVFYGSKLVQVEHTGKNLPRGTRRLAKLPDEIKYLETSEGGAAVSVLERGNRRFLVVVNHDILNPMTLTIVTADKVKRVLKDATLVPASDYMPVMEVDPGDAMIYTWEK
jgi:hypothetical protein